MTFMRHTGLKKTFLFTSVCFRSDPYKKYLVRDLSSKMYVGNIYIQVPWDVFSPDMTREKLKVMQGSNLLLHIISF